MKFDEEKDEIESESKIANTYGLGIFLGIFVPIIAILFFNYSISRTTSPIVFFKNMVQLKIMANILSLTGIPNLIMFFLFFKLNKTKTVKGLMLATVLLAITVFVVKFVF